MTYSRLTKAQLIERIESLEECVQGASRPTVTLEAIKNTAIDFWKHFRDAINDTYNAGVIARAYHDRLIWGDK